VTEYNLESIVGQRKVHRTTSHHSTAMPSAPAAARAGASIGALKIQSDDARATTNYSDVTFLAKYIITSTTLV
jgi:hypothetical protein